MKAQVNFGVLGPVEARIEGRLLSLGPPQQRTVLAVLLLNAGLVTSTDNLVEALWADNPPAAAVKTVRTYISRLRAALGPAGDLIETSASGYLLRVGPDCLDLAVFRQLTSVAPASAAERADRARRALKIFRGEPLAGLPGSWAEINRGQISHLRAAAFESLFTAELEAGHQAEAITGLAAAIAQFPFHERLRELHITALYRTGQRADAFAAYQAVRKLLDDELGVEPMPALQELHLRMLHNDPALLTPAGAAPSPESEPPAGPSRRPRPAQLVAAPVAFTGRHRELRHASQLLESAGPGPAVVVISGMGGVGKTSFALHWAHGLTARYPDGQLYTDLRGYGPSREPLTPDEVLGGFLHALEVAPGDVPESLEARAKLFRSLVADRRLLILLDNAASADQLLDLLPGAGPSLVVVTSRGTLPALVVRTGAPLLALHPPDHDEALALFAARATANRVHAEPAAADAIVELCGRLPLALAVAAARAAAAAHLPLAKIADDLTARHGTLSAFRLQDAAFDVSAVLSWSHHALGDSSAEAFRLLCLHPGPDLSAEAAASLLARPVEETRDLLAELVAAALLTEHRPGRWTIHDLVRAYGDDLTLKADDADLRRAALHRLLDHYLYAGKKADSQLFRRELPIVPEQPVPGVAGMDAAPAAWFDTEWPAALSAIDLAYRNEFDRHAWQLSWVVREYLNRQGLWHHLRAVQRVALAASARGARPEAEALTRLGAGRAEFAMGRYPETLIHVRRALALFEQIGDEKGAQEAGIFIAAVFGSQGEHSEALQRYESLLAAHPPGTDITGRARVLMEMSWTKAQLGRYAEAVADAREVIDSAPQVSPFRLADTWDTLGYAQIGLGEVGQAAGSYHRAVDLYLQHGAPVWAAESLRRLGDVFQRAGREAEAEAAYRRAAGFVEKATGPQAAHLSADLEKILSAMPAR